MTRGGSSSARPGALRELASGVRALLGGVGFVVRTPGVWGWALAPALVTLGVGCAIFGGGLWLVNRVTIAILGTEGAFAGLGRFVVDAVLGVGIAFVAIVVALGVAQPLSRFALDPLARRVDESLGATRSRAVRAPASGLLGSLRVLLTALGVSLPVIGALEGATLMVPEAGIVTEPIAFVVSALALAWELFDHPLSRRGLGVAQRLRWMRGNFALVLGFALAAQALLLVPGLDLLVLPIGIAGATRLLAEREPDDHAH